MRQAKQSVKGMIMGLALAVGLSGMAHAAPGDVDGDNAVSLGDAVLSLRAVAGVTELDIDVDGDWDLGGDDAVGLAEVVYALKYVAENSGVSDTFTNSLGMTFVRIPAGTFTMGSPENEPGRDSDETPHQVTLTQDFYMMTTEATQAQWETVMGSNPSYFSDCGGNCPVEKVSWNDVQDFITALNAMDGRTHRLPTEAEWEYAARAGTTTAFYSGVITHTGSSPVDPNLDAIGWYHGNSDGGSSDRTSHPVAGKQPNDWGLYDMSGNVLEWCQDWYGAYPAGPVTDPEGPADGSERVLRGGGLGSFAENCRSAERKPGLPSISTPSYGFRLALTPVR